MTIYPVILAGGRGTRLWPLSRSDKPKQFLPMHGERSLFQRTILRHAHPAPGGRPMEPGAHPLTANDAPQALGANAMQGANATQGANDTSGANAMPALGAPWIVCGTADRFQVEDGLAGIGVTNVTVVLEPAARNTAPAIAAVAEALVRRDPEAILFVLPSDHLVTPDASYYGTLAAAFEAARAGKMVTFGVVPTHPETGYGYIKAGEGGPVTAVERFVEKPPLEEAVRMVADGHYYWNAGFFALGARALLDELGRTAPKVAAAAKAAVDGASQGTSPGAASILLPDVYKTAPDISIDYALFERTDKAAVAPISCRWSDVGSWSAYWDTLDKDSSGNAIRGKGIAVDASHNLIVSSRVDVVALGVENLAIVAADDAILVCPLDRAQDVKKVVALLRETHRSELLDVSPTVNRPWGGYTSIMNGPRFQVKHLFVAPGKRLSLQRHYHRAEHWVVVRGTAEVTIDEGVHTLSENQSIYLPLGCVHRLANPGRILLEVIEVQTGSYLGEDDIVRLQDEWGRQ